MSSLGTAGREILLAIVFGWVSMVAGSSGAEPTTEDAATNEIRIVELQGTVEISPAGATTWVLTQTNQVLRPLDRLRTGANSRAALRWSDQSVVPFGALTEIEILPRQAPDAQSGLRFLKGVLSFFHRDKPGRIRIITRGSVAGVEGTEFVLQVEAVNTSERTTISVIDGTVQFSNEHGALKLTNGQQAIADLGQAPVRTAGFIANNVLQWCFYYPAVLDLRDLPLTSEEEEILGDSLAAYRAGDLLEALARYPPARQPGSDNERVYYAALLLSVGQAEQTSLALASLPAAAPSERLSRLATALRQVIAAVNRQPNPSTLSPQLSTEFLAASYYEQSRASREASLKTALDLARQAVTNSADFGFAWARVAELEFSFGRTGSALDALNKALALAPRNAPALALKGFLLAAQNKTREAIEWFDKALAVDSALGNAWLGRGVCRIRRRDARGGREDLLVAAALEPQRALLRGYLGKAWSNAGDTQQAGKELDLAKGLDPADPTVWLYSALLHQRNNRINEGIRDLEKSQELNDNRRLYRSRLLLDQDRAVRGANLANLYRDAGMTDVSVREAGRAVNADYANYSSHLFLANSYNEIRDPKLVNLRYETAASSEYLLANLLSPIQAGTLSQAVSQQEYANLFERDRLGVSSTTEYFSSGDWVQSGAQYGTLGNFGYSLEAFYRSEAGQRPNNDLEQRLLSLQAKQQLTSQDMVYFRGSLLKVEGGDLFQRYDQTSFSPTLRTTEKQEPLVTLGYHHEWHPGSHALFLANYVDDRFTLFDEDRPALAVCRFSGAIEDVAPFAVVEDFEGRQEFYGAELQQIWQRPAFHTIIGARAQGGQIESSTTLPEVKDFQPYFPDPPAVKFSQDVHGDFHRWSIYAYHQQKVVEAFWLSAGLGYDELTFPENFLDAPLSGKQRRVTQFSPKAGLIWTPAKHTVCRAAYTRSLSGANLDQSFQLEPTQVAGFTQTYRSLVPESVTGGSSGACFETAGLSVEQKLGSSTYLGVVAEILKSQVERTRGAFDLVTNSLLALPSKLEEHLDYRERSLLFTVNQLVGPEWAIGARYRISEAELDDDFVGVPESVVSFDPKQHLESVLHQLNLYAIYNHASGLFGRCDAVWSAQSNHGYNPAAPGDDFWQWNVLAGYRFRGRRAEITLGILNLTDQDYELSPLNLYYELPRERTFVARLTFNF